MAPAGAADDANSVEPASRDAGKAAPADSDNARQENSKGVNRVDIRSERFIELLDAGDGYRRFIPAGGAGSAAK